VSNPTFGPFSLDVAASRLLREGAEVRLRPQAVELLKVLLRHGGRSVSHEQLIAEAWNGTFVSRHTVDVTVSEVKKSLGEYGRWIVNRPKIGYSLQVPSSDELVRRGWHFWNRRTREGALRGIESFTEAANDCPRDFRAYEGLSACYLTLASYGMASPREMYAKFQEFHERAVELGGLTPELRSNRAHGLHLFERRYAEAEEELLRVLRERPNYAVAHVRMAMLYRTLGRYEKALEMIRLGYQADPLLPTLSVIEVGVHFWRREFETAITQGAKMIELHPYLQIGRATYAQALEYVERYDEALRQYHLASVMSPDLPWINALKGVCLVKMERHDEASTLLEELEQLRRFEYVDAFYMALLRAALGYRDDAFAELERASEENSVWLYSLIGDPKIDVFAGDPRVDALRARMIQD
jgi:DNA-binding winged helix-turn-helix (wHTH) protein